MAAINSTTSAIPFSRLSQRDWYRDAQRRGLTVGEGRREFIRRYEAGEIVGRRRNRAELVAYFDQIHYEAGFLGWSEQLREGA